MIISKLINIIQRLIIKKGVKTFIYGMALGIDIWSALIILNLKKKYPDIKLVCEIPCKKQYRRWREEDKEVWKYVIDNADYVYYVSDEEYSPQCMQKRNKWMVDNSNFVIAVWDGMKEVESNPSIVKSNEWNERINKEFRSIEDVYNKLEKLPYVPDEYKERHRLTKEAIGLTLKSRDKLIEGVRNVDEELINEGLLLINESGVKFDQINSINSDQPNLK